MSLQTPNSNLLGNTANARAFIGAFNMYLNENPRDYRFNISTARNVNRLPFFSHEHHSKQQILRSVLEHRAVTNHTVRQYLPPHWSIQLLHCTSDLSPQICFLFPTVTELIRLWHGRVVAVMVPVRPLRSAARWRVALFVEMCSAIQFHSSVSDESWRRVRREGTVIERQWSSSCVPPSSTFIPFVYISLIFVCAFVFALFNVTVSVFLRQWTIHKITYYKHNWHGALPPFVPAFVDGTKLSHICPKKKVFWSLPRFEPKPFAVINNWITCVTAEIIILATWKKLNFHGKAHCYHSDLSLFNLDFGNKSFLKLETAVLKLELFHHH